MKSVKAMVIKRITKMLNVNEMKKDIVNKMCRENTNIERLVECLSAMDRLSHSGAYDLNDQIATMEKLVEKMYEVIGVSFAVIGE